VRRLHLIGGDVLRLTLPADPIMDLKGETVFGGGLHLGTLTRERLRRGLIADDPRAQSRPACVAVEFRSFSATGARLLRDNVSVGRRVAGHLRRTSPSPPSSGIASRRGAGSRSSPTGIAPGDLDLAGL
jgi:hypothetical protein